MLGVLTASDRLSKLTLLRRQGTISALEALRDALYKSTYILYYYTDDFVHNVVIARLGYTRMGHSYPDY